jgi:sulfate permease, SulP family
MDEDEVSKQFMVKRKFIKDDIIAGLTGAVAGAPQAMGFALIAGVSPIYGLYAAIVSTIVGTLVSNSSLMTISPTNALSIVVFSALHNGSESFTIERLFVLTILIGVFQLAFGILRLGDLTQFVSNAVMTGFIAGAGLLIILGQLANFTGYGYSNNVTGVLPKFWDWLTHSPQWNLPTLGLGMIALAVMLIFWQLEFKQLAPLTAIIVASGLVEVLGWQDIRIVRDITTIPTGLPQPILPNFAYTFDLLPAALSMAIFALVQSVGVSQSAPESDEHTPDINRDFVAQGLANMVGGIFQGMPSGGSLSRTAVNVAAGAKSRLSNLLAGLFIAITVLTVGEYIEQVAIAALAALLIVIGASLIKLDQIRLVWQVNHSGRAVMVATFCATLFMPLEYSIYVGVILSLGLYVYTSSQSIEIVMLEQTDDHQFLEFPVPEKLPDRKPIILSIHGNLYFAAVNHLETLLPSVELCQSPVVIIRLRHNHYMGSTGIRLLERYSQQVQKHGGRLILTGVGADIYQQLERTGALQRLGEENVYYANGTILDTTTQALRSAYQWLQSRKP